MSEADDLFHLGHLNMAAAAIIRGKCFLTVVAGKTESLLPMIGHADFVVALFNFEEFRVTTAAFRLPTMRFVIESDLFFSERIDFLDGRNIFSPDLCHWFQSMNTDMAACALGIGGKTIFAVMTYSAVLSFVQSIHVEVFFLLDFQSFHCKKTVVATLAGKVLFRRVCTMVKTHGIERLSVKNSFSVRRDLRGCSATGRYLIKREY